MIYTLSGVPAKLKTLLDRLTATWAGKLDTLHDSRLTASRAAALDSLSDLDVPVSSRMGGVNAIYRGSVTVSVGTGGTVSSATATITAVNMSKTEVRPMGATLATQNGAQLNTRVELTNATTVTAFAGGGVSGSSVNATVGYEVIEYN